MHVPRLKKGILGFYSMDFINFIIFHTYINDCDPSDREGAPAHVFYRI